MELRKSLINALKSNKSYELFKKLDKEGVLEKIFVQAPDMKVIGECKYHVVNCFEHSLNALKEFEEIISEANFFSPHLKCSIKEYLSNNLENDISILNLLRLGIFMHDIGKPKSKTVDETGRVHFRRHEIIGADEAYKVGKILDLSKKSQVILYNYIRHHMILLSLYTSNNMIQNDLYKLFDETKDDIIGVIVLGYVDIVSTRKLLNPDEDINIIKTYMEYVLTNYIYRYKRK